MRQFGVLVSNGAFTKGPAVSARILRRSAALQHIDVILGCEFKHVRADAQLSDRWGTVQYLSSAATRGSVIAYRHERFMILDRGIEYGTHGGRETLTRYLVWADLRDRETGKVYRFVSLHMPPKRAWAYWPEMMRNFLKLRASSPHPVIAGGDWNKLGRAVSAATKRRWRGVHILGLSLPRMLLASRADGVNIGSDHKGVEVHLAHKG